MNPSSSAQTEERPFYLGLCLAGAISAGAYTAGVMDYLIEALDRWEKARATGDPRVPTHRVVLDLMTGASAGGMTAAISLAALFDRIDPVSKEQGGYRDFDGYNKLYEAWVRLTGDEMLPQMLDTSDIDKHGAASVLNSDFIDTIAERMLKVENRTMRPYVSEDIEICLSISSLTGIPTVINFGNTRPTQLHATAREVEDRYITYNHRDYGHFIVDREYNNDGRIPVSFWDQNDKGLRTLKDCAMATGAFPVGLRWRPVHRLGKYLNQNPLINPQVERPMLGIEDDKVFSTVNVDGGMLNNEPFEIAQQIFKRFRGRNLLQGEETEATILMIDPFPSVEDEDQIKPDGNILLRTIIGEIYSTMRTQLLFKPNDLEEATNPTVYNRFLMAPTRTPEGEETVIGSRAIACGSLDGFGGFITKDFREHDFQLGRRNCQRFLRKHFVMRIDTTNPIIKQGYANPEALTTYKEKVKRTDPAGNPIIVSVLPIIPDVNLDHPSGKPDPEEKPAYPVYHPQTMRDLISKNDDAIKERLRVLLDDNKVIDLDNFFTNLLVSLLDDRVSEKVINIVMDDLRTHQLVRDDD